MMKCAYTISVAILMVGLMTPALAQKGSIGEDEYRRNCATCHGISGNGDGPFAEYLKNSAPSLATLSKDNGGVFPFERVYGIIDGRSGVLGHGPSEMPIWGDEYRARSVREHGPFFGEFYAEDRVRARILSLIDYVHSLQAR